jgi:hypothetical protein
MNVIKHIGVDRVFGGKSQISGRKTLATLRKQHVTRKPQATEGDLALVHASPKSFTILYHSSNYPIAYTASGKRIQACTRLCLHRQRVVMGTRASKNLRT